MNIPGFLDMRNKLNTARWSWKWHLNGGGFHWRARDLEDSRTCDLLERGRDIETKVRQARRELQMPRKVVNLATLRIQRGLRKKA